MIDVDHRHDRFEQIFSVQENLNKGQKISQADIKEAVIFVNQLRNENDRFDGDVQLALAMANLNFWRGKAGISFEPDLELAMELKSLQKHALAVLGAKRQPASTIDSGYQPIDPIHIKQHVDFAEHNLLVVSKYLGDLINQATPSEPLSQE